MNFSQKAGSLLTNPGIRQDYIRWLTGRHLTGDAPAIDLPKGRRLYPADRFNDYVAIRTQHPDDSEWRLVNELLAGAQGGMFVDVGANVGAMSVLAHSTGLTSDILAFEPSHRYCAAWHRNIVANQVAGATLVQAAVGDYDGVVEFRVDPALLLNGKIDRGKVHYSDVKEKVRIVRLDSVLEAFGVGSIALLKLDVEGAEPLVIQGAERTLASGRVATILLEFIVEFMEDMGADPYQYAKTLQRIGFQLYAIGEDGSHARICDDSPQAIVDARRSAPGAPQRSFAGINLVAKLAGAAQ